MRTQSGLIRLTALAVLTGLFLSAASFATDDKRNLTVSKPATAAAQVTERRLALVIGNGAYDVSPLRNPVNDARAIASALRQSGFQVIEHHNLTQSAMREAIRAFGDQLRSGGVGLFYYAGHGMQVKGRNYLLPVKSDVKREDEIEDQAVSADLVLQKLDAAKNRLNIVILDACRNNPFASSFRSAARGLAQMDAPSGTLVAFATAPGSVAADGRGNNGLYTQHLVANIKQPGLRIEDVFKRVRVAVKRDSNGLQVPWENTSLEGDFYFKPGKAGESPSPTLASLAPTLAPTPAPEEPSDSMSKEIGRDGRFTAYNNGTVLDTRTNLMWAAKDNGSNISWAGAKSYSEQYRGGGFTDWRMPTLYELRGLRDESKTYKSECRGPLGGTWDIHVTELIRTTCNFSWASETGSDNDAHYIDFERGVGPLAYRSASSHLRALPVRSAK